MSLNIAPHIPHTVVNASAPATESLAHANAIKEVVPATTQVEAYVPQKSREQDNRPPALDNPTYDDIKQPDPKIIPDQEQDERHASDQSDQNNANGEEGEEPEASSQAQGSDETSEDETQAAAEQKAQERIEQAEQKAELQQVRQLERRDAEVRAHEQAHASVGGAYAGSPSYDYETGPNGKKYAVGGEVSISLSEEGTPQETIKKMQTVRAAALAPAEPSSQDRKVAAEATQKIAEARAELINETSSVQATKSQGLNREDESESSFSVNTESPLGQEPRMRALREERDGAQDISTSEQQASLDYSNEETARVIQQRYAATIQREASGFRALA